MPDEHDNLSIAALLRLAADGELTPELRDRLSTHLAQHPGDRARIESFQLYRQNIPGPCAFDVYWPRQWVHDAEAEAIQFEVYEVGKRHPFPDLRSWFKALYEILLGQSQGPRMGSFFALYGLAESIRLIERALAGEDLNAAT